MQLPFIRRLLPDAAIVPLLMGYQTRETIQGFAEALARVARTGRQRAAGRQHGSVALLRRADGRGARSPGPGAVAACDPDRLLAIFEEYPEGERGRFVACGGGPRSR